MLILGITDAAILEGLPMQKEPSTITEQQPTPNTQQPTPSNPPAEGVARNQGPDVKDILQDLGFTLADVNEKVILEDIIPQKEASLQSYVLLKNGDRTGMIAWTDSPKVKVYYLALKEALHSAFTEKVQNLLDETQRRENRPIRNLLTFIDTGLFPERMVFVRVRERLYEFHVKDGSSEEIFNLIEGLTQ